jgi:small subunit ribosomal protein S8
MFSNIKNSLAVKKSYMYHLKNNICIGVLNVLWDEGFINGFKVCLKKKMFLKIFLRYNKNIPVISLLKTISKPGKRVHLNNKSIWKLDDSLGLFILSTDKGVLSLTKCKELNIGGELICYVQE